MTITKHSIFYIFILLSAVFFTTPAKAQTSADELPRQGFLGAQVASVPDEQRVRLKLSPAQGVAIMRVDKESSAEAAGLAAGDIILKAADKDVNSAPNFVGLIRPFRANQKVALTVLRGGKEQNINVTLKPRPLETSPDFEVLYRAVNTAGGRRRVIITRPKTNGKFPAVLMVGGIGCYSLDNFPPGHAYRKILYNLTEQGFATMRVEKTGTGDSEGAPCNSPQADLRQEIEGYVAGLRVLKTYDFVDADKTFIFGHSIGGIVGPAVAAEEKTRGLIVAATVGTNWYEYALENFRRQAVLRGESYDEVEAGARLNQICKRRLWIEKQPREQILKDNAACADFLQDPAPAAYMQQLTELNLAETWKKIDAPTLIIYGASDFLTSAKEHEYLREMINKFHPGKAKYVEIPVMDHYFERAATQSESMQRLGNPPPTPPGFVEQSLTEISNWLKANLNKLPVTPASVERQSFKD
jgi:pimeloyl-ACP methyl ester carboxylesterase